MVDVDFYYGSATATPGLDQPCNLLVRIYNSENEDRPSANRTHPVITRSVCGSKIWSPHTRPAAADLQFESAHALMRHPLWLQTGTVISEMDLPSLHLQRLHCSVSMREEDNGMRRCFCSCDLDLDPMTLICELYLKILKMYPHSKMNFPGQGFQQLEHYRHAYIHTNKYVRTHYHATFVGDNKSFTYDFIHVHALHFFKYGQWRWFPKLNWPDL